MFYGLITSVAGKPPLDAALFKLLPKSMRYTTPSRIHARVFKEQTLPTALIAHMLERVVEAKTERMKATS